MGPLLVKGFNGVYMGKAAGVTARAEYPTDAAQRPAPERRRLFS
jgi:hypothetical protein